MQTNSSPIDSKRGFDAVAESRRWKEAVATSGMSITERMVWFRSQSSVPAIRSKAKRPKVGT
jgi:hypothetical protein